MNQKLTRLSRRYLTVLRKHLLPGAAASMRPALGLGRAAVALGLDTLELAQIHEQALVTLELSKTKNGFNKLAGIFFTEANAPIEETHRAARQDKIRLNCLQEALGQRTEELAAGKRQLKRGVVRRKVMEQAAEKRGRHHQQCLKESLALQKRLRQLTHRLITTQEDDRKKISHDLQDQIAQTLLGINVRLLSLKQGDRSRINGLKNEITSAQRLVAKSAQAVRRFARELHAQQPAISAQSVSTI